MRQDATEDPLARARAVLALLSVDPAGLKGLWLRARAGPVRDMVLASLKGMNSRRLHPTVSDEALFGGLDLAAALAGGGAVRTPGLLEVPGPLVLTMAERCPPGLAARLSRVLDQDGFSLVALDEGADGSEGLPGALADRLGLFLDLNDAVWSDCTDPTPDAEAVRAAQVLLPQVTLPEGVAATLTRVAAGAGIVSLRAPALALAATRAAAALAGRLVANDDDLRTACDLVFGHRADPATEVEADPPAPPPEPPQPDRPPPDSEQPEPPLPEDPAPDETPPDDADPDTAAQANLPPDEMLIDAVRTALPPEVMAALAAGRATRAAQAASGSGAGVCGNRRGRPLPPRPGRPGGGVRLDLVSTLRAAAPWQRMRQGPAGHEGLKVRASDLRVKRYLETSDRVLIFAVDASGSAAVARLAEAKGAVELLLAQAYARRDHVALVVFKGRTAELVLPPTRSLVQTKRRLAGLPGGGGTPLANGLEVALAAAGLARARGMTPTLALLTDGRGNIALDGSPGRPKAEADALRMAALIRAARIPAVVIDTGLRPQPALRALAAAMDAPCLPLPRLDAHRLSAVLSLALEA